MRSFVRFAVDYPITVTMAFLAVILLGYISFGKLGMDLFPDLNSPRIYVELTSGERPPEEIETQFLEKIEAQIIRQKGVVRVSSTARAGEASVTVEYAWNTAMDEAFLDLQRAMQTYSANNDIDELTISQQDPNASPVILLGFSNPHITDMDELRKVAENYIRNELVRLEGIAEVRLLGTEEKEVVVRTDDYRMAAFGVTPSTISQKIQSYNRNISGGSIVDMGTSYTIKGVGELTSLDDIAGVIVGFRTPETASASDTSSTSASQIPIYLRDVADVEMRNQDPENIVRVNGRRCVGIAVFKETRYNTVKAVNEFFESLADIRKALPGYEFIVIKNQGDFVEGAINEVKQSALIGMLLAVLVLFVFLRSIGTTFIISISIPISIIATFNLMYFNGLTLNIMTLGGLALGAGMLVDNAIIVVESIFRNLETGLPLRKAAVEGTVQVGAAVTASTITTIVVFLPIVYLHGSAGELFKDQAWTVSFSLISSLAVAVFAIPMLAARFLRPEPARARRTPVRYPRYHALLGRFLDRKWTVIGATAAIVAASLLMLPRLGSEFIPVAGARDFIVSVQLPEGASLKRTAGAAESVEQIIRGLLGKNIGSLYSLIGPSSETDEETDETARDENTAAIRISLAKEADIPPDEVVTLLNRAFANIPGAEIQAAQEQTALDVTLGMESAPLVVEIRGKDIPTLQRLTAETKSKLSAVSDLRNIRTSFDEGRPEVEVVLDRERAGILDVSVETLSSRMQEHLSGTSAGEWENSGELRDITIELPRLSVNQLGDILLQSGSAEIPVSEIAGVRVVEAPKVINRRDQERVGLVTADLTRARPLDKVVGDIQTSLAGVAFPKGYRYRISGEEGSRREAFDNLKFAFLLSIVLMYMVLASQFESLVHPFTIMLAVPTAAVGAILLFFIMGNSLNIMAFIGIIMLMGIAVNDSIVLVDAIIQLRRQGVPLREAVLEAGQRRLRPIVMTSLTTILGMLPLTIGLGEGASLRSPMALAVIGGMISSTLLTLVVIPCIYLAMDRLTVSGRNRAPEPSPAETE